MWCVSVSVRDNGQEEMLWWINKEWVWAHHHNTTTLIHHIFSRFKIALFILHNIHHHHCCGSTMGTPCQFEVSAKSKKQSRELLAWALTLSLLRWKPSKTNIIVARSSKTSIRRTKTLFFMPPSAVHLIAALYPRLANNENVVAIVKIIYQNQRHLVDSFDYNINLNLSSHRKPWPKKGKKYSRWCNNYDTRRPWRAAGEETKLLTHNVEIRTDKPGNTKTERQGKSHNCDIEGVKPKLTLKGRIKIDWQG